MFVAVEGIDGAGTTTLVGNLRDMLTSRGISVHVTQEPSSLSVGQFIRSELSTSRARMAERMALLFAADRVEHYFTEILPASKKNVVISDRYKLSSLAYQGALGADIHWVESINSRVPWPDLTIYVEIDPKEAIRRLNTRASLEEYETLQFQQKVARMYGSLLREHDFPVVILDGTLPPMELASVALKHIMEVMGEHSESS